MVALSDETRFKNLPNTEEWIEFKQRIENSNSRIIILQETYWPNALTRCKGKVLDIPIFAIADNSNKTMAVTRVEHCLILNSEEDATENYHSKIISNSEKESWVFNTDYTHTNITTQDTNFIVKYKIEDTEYAYRIWGKLICCPITNHHLYTQDLNNLTLLFKGQLMGQNSGSPYRTVDSVANNYYDAAIRDDRGSFIKRTAPIIQLLTKKTINELTDYDDIGNLLQRLDLPTDESKVLVKLTYNNYYITATKEKLEEYKSLNLISAYYPIITYEQTQNILDNLPKINMNIGIIGLGSAGSGILDQVIRSNFFKKYFICDFDRVEEKNLRNQWYTRDHVTHYKALASRTQMLKIKQGTSIEIVSKTEKFQSAHLNSYTFKYLVSGFDSIECRLELLDYIEQGKTTAQYIIDARYDDLASSIFFIDTSNKEEMAYYRQGLLSDKEAFDKKEQENAVQTFEEFIEWLKEYNLFENGCPAFHYKVINPNTSFDCEISGNCGGEECQTYLKTLWENPETKAKIQKHCHKDQHQESSCVRENFIDIYKFSSAFVFAAIRAIENEEQKPFTHIEATTEGIPRSILIRK